MIIFINIFSSFYHLRRVFSVLVEELSNEVERLRNVGSAKEHQNPIPQNDEIFTLATPLNISTDEYVDFSEQMKSNMDIVLHELSPKGTCTFQHGTRCNELPMVVPRSDLKSFISNSYQPLYFLMFTLIHLIMTHAFLFFGFPLAMMIGFSGRQL